MVEVVGFPVAALDFYDDLEVDNTRSFWERHRSTYEESVKAPMVALTDALAPEFGPAKVFRPHRDVRFAKDKRPMKEHQGAFVPVGPATGYYVQLSAAGVRVSVGFYRADPPVLGSIRSAMADDRTGAELQRIIAGLETCGWVRSGDSLKTAPRGFPKDHPRIELLRLRSLTLGRSYGFAPFIHTPDLATRVGEDWRAGRSLVDWILEAT